MAKDQQIVAGHGSVPLRLDEVQRALPLDKETQRHIEDSRNAIRTLLSQNHSDGRLLVIVGPCSIHDPIAALDYASRLAPAARKYSRELLIVMRVYIEKPRTTVGWKGLVHDPDYFSSRGTSTNNLQKGLLVSRQVMLEIARTRLPIATELLNPLLVQFFQDLVSVGVIGARTTESQTHREMASDMPMPVGIKNGTDGGLKVAIDAMTAASRSHTVVGTSEDGSLEYRPSYGNLDTFMILRGGNDGPNFSPEHVKHAEKAMLNAGKKPSIVVDCSHGNSMKDYRNQGKVASALCDQIGMNAPITGVMIESNINSGRQDVQGTSDDQGLGYGVSITDGCVGWSETESILDRLAAAVRKRQTDTSMIEVLSTLNVMKEPSVTVQERPVST